jgi:D-aspartate ligase
MTLADPPVSKATKGHLPPPRSFVLTMGNYQGTLAAARDLGRGGVSVVLAEAQSNTLAAQSRYVTRQEICPGLEDPEQFVAWLLAFGQREPGHVLYPTGDDVCWLLDRHRDALSQYYYLYQPPQGGLYPFLNKRQLHAHCQALGIDQPDMWTPEQALDPSGARPVHYPVLVKPQTQAGMRINVKGIVANSQPELEAALAQFRHQFAYRPEMLAHDPGLADVMVQAFHPEAAEHIYSLAGFYAPEIDLCLLRASEKILQQPMRIGVGLCFESRPVHAEPARQLLELMRTLRYCGAFEAEFIHLKDQNRFLLIDFNTRFYGQMGFEIARGIPMAQLCYRAATGDWDAVTLLANQAKDWDHATRWCFRNAWMLKLFATTQWMGGNLTWAQRQAWLAWSRHAPCADPAFAEDDPAPAMAARRRVWRELLRHPRSTLRKYFRR